MLTKTDLSSIQKMLNSTLKVELSDIKEDIGTLKVDVSSLKTDVSGLKVDVSSLKTDVSGLKSDVYSLKKSFGNLEKSVGNLEVGQRKHSGQIVGLSNQISELNRDMKQGFKEVIDLVSPAFTAHERILGKHEVRITQLEKTSIKTN